MSNTIMYDLHEVRSGLSMETKTRRRYVFSNHEETRPKLIILEADKIVKEFSSDDLVRIRWTGETSMKLVFGDSKISTFQKIISGKTTTRTLRFGENEAEAAKRFVETCKQFRPNVEIEHVTGMTASSTTDTHGGHVEPVDTSSYHDSTGMDMDTTPRGMYAEQLGSVPTKKTSMLEEEEEYSTNSVSANPTRTPLPIQALATMLSYASYTEHMKETCSLPKFFGRVRNRYGMLEGKTISVSEDAVKFVSTWNSLHAFASTKKDDDDDVPEEMLIAPAMLNGAIGMAPGTGNNSNATDLVAIWSLPKSRIRRLVLYSEIGTHVLIKLDDDTELDCAFEHVGARDEFAANITPSLSLNDAMVNFAYAGGEDCAVADLQNPWHDFACFTLKILGNVKIARVFVINRVDKCIWVFRNNDMTGGCVSEMSNPERLIALGNGGLFVEASKSYRGRIRWGQTVSTVNRGTDTFSAAALSGSSLMSSREGNTLDEKIGRGGGPVLVTFDAVFLNYFERERFASHLLSLTSQLKIVAPKRLLRAKNQRLAWHRPFLQWFEVKKALFIGSFNVGDCAPPEPALLELWVARPVRVKRDFVGGMMPKAAPRLRAKSGSAGITGKFSVYVFGLQECGNKFDDWVKALTTHLGSEYGLVNAPKLWEIGLVVFAALSEIDRISQVESNTVATGRGIAKEVTGMQLGNKGGVGLGMRWRDTSFCFINAHLAPHQEKIKERNQNFQQIVNKLNLTGSSGDAGELGLESTHAFDHVFFFGDLNYRVDDSFQNVISIASKGNWSKLLEMDQLTKELASNHAYSGFKEIGVPNFPPTYRWERGKRAFSNKRDQPPSYTDRILIHSRPGLENKIVTGVYGSSQDLMISDHRPIAATFTCTIREPYSPWPLHPLTAELPAKEFVEDAPNFNDGSQLSGDSSATGGGPYIVSDLARPFSSSSYLPYNPSMTSAQLVSSDFVDNMNESGNGTTTVALSQESEMIKDLDEEDEIFESFLGPVGSMFVPPELFTQTDSTITPPEIRLTKILLRLNPREDKPPPTFVRLRVTSRIAHEIVNVDVAPGCEVHPDDVVKGETREYAFQYETQRTWRELFYSWSKPIVGGGGVGEDDSSLPSATHVMRPTIWDPCYLSAQHIVVAVEQPPASVQINAVTRMKQAMALTPVDDDASVCAEASPLITESSRKTLIGSNISPIGGYMMEEGRASNVASRLSTKIINRARGRSVGAAVMQVGAAMMGNNSSSVTTAPVVTGGVLVGQANIYLKNIVEEIRRTTAKNASSSWWTRDSYPSIAFEEPIVISGVMVGYLSGEIQLIPGNEDAMRQMFATVKKSTMLSRASSRQYDPLFARINQVEVQVEGMLDNKKGAGWRKLYAALSTSGVLYLSLKSAGSRSGLSLLESFQKASILICDCADGTSETALAGGGAADRPYILEVTGKKLACTDAGVPNRVVITLAFKEDLEKKLWMSTLYSIQATRDAEKEAFTRVAIESGQRKVDRIRRLEEKLEKKRKEEEEKRLSEDVEKIKKPEPSVTTPSKVTFLKDSLASPNSSNLKHTGSFFMRAITMSRGRSLHRFSSAESADSGATSNSRRNWFNDRRATAGSAGEASAGEAGKKSTSTDGRTKSIGGLLELSFKDVDVTDVPRAAAATNEDEDEDEDDVGETVEMTDVPSEPRRSSRGDARNGEI